jgi:hypothetical protein
VLPHFLLLPPTYIPSPFPFIREASTVDDAEYRQALTGMVKTKFLQNMQTRSLPPNSVYLPAKEVIDTALSGKVMEDRAMDVDVYAEEFVRNALAARPSVRYWSAVDSWRVWAVERILGGGVVWVSFFSPFLFSFGVSEMVSMCG